MSNDELQHYGVVGMKWGVRKSFRASEARRKTQHKQSMKRIRDSYNDSIKKQKALTKATKGSNPTVHKLSKETTKYLRDEKKHNLAAEKDRYKYHHSKKGDTDAHAHATYKSNQQKINDAKKQYKKDPSDTNKKSYEQAYRDGLAYMSSPAYQKYVRNLSVVGALGGPGAALGYQFAIEHASKKVR